MDQRIKDASTAGWYGAMAAHGIYDNFTIETIVMFARFAFRYAAWALK